MKTLLSVAMLVGLTGSAVGQTHTPEQISKLIEARGYKCPLNDLNPRVVTLHEMSDARGPSMTVYCRQVGAGGCPTVHVYRVTHRGGGRVSVQQYVDPRSGKVVFDGC